MAPHLLSSISAAAYSTHNAYTSCVLSPSASAFSTMLSAFVGSIIVGVSSGPLVAFISGWIAWVACLRVLTASAYEFYLALSGKVATASDEKRGLMLESKVSTLGWIGWVWSALYTPVSQTIWVVARLDSKDGGMKLVRAVAIGVSALGLAFDNKHRYADTLPFRFVFKVWHAMMCLLLGAECVFLLVKGAIDLHLGPGPIVGYCVVSAVFAFGSWKMLPVANGVWKRGFVGKPVSEALAGALVGAFVGVAVAAPAFGLWRDAEFRARYPSSLWSSAGGLSLDEYLSCEGASIAEKWAAIMP